MTEKKTKKVSHKDTSLIGAAGEHLVLSRLLSRGILAAPAPRGARKADILVNHLDSSNSFLIQVKTRSGKGSEIGWHMNKKHETLTDKDLFYCFVDMGTTSQDIFVIPASVIAKVTRDSYQAWLKAPGKNDRPHQETDLRRITMEYKVKVRSAPSGWMDEYKERWDYFL